MMGTNLAPLSERMRPSVIDEFVGQDHLTGPEKLLRRMIDYNELYSIILWGPPGTGKTTLANIIANASSSLFTSLSAVNSGIKDVRRVIDEAKKQRTKTGKSTLLFIDEIHRFNKAQQDAFLPHVERGDIVLIGATTENPSFEVISPLLSRTKVLVLKPLTFKHIKDILNRSINDKKNGLGLLNIKASDTVIKYIIDYSQGDARIALNTLEISVMMTSSDKHGYRVLSKQVVEEALQNKVLRYDKSGEEHYNIISALHKSLRGSDVHASLYWLGRMIEAGEDPLYIVRRLIRFASEDIGNADPRALQIALNAKDAFHFIGLPEGTLALVQACIYLATAPKSNAVYNAYTKVQDIIKKTGFLPVPLHIRNAPTSLMKNIGYGKGYKYDHKYPEAIAQQDFLPEEIKNSEFYFPSERGFEKTIKERLEYINKKKKGGD